MPSIDRLAGVLGGENFAVVALSTDRDGPEKVAEFFKGIRIKNLKVMHDRTRKVSRQAGVLGLPVTLILDRQGREVGRLIGPAEWDSPEARKFLIRLIEMTGEGPPQTIRA